MREFLELNECLYYHCFDITLKTKKNTAFKAWIGAVVRNNFMYAADSVQVEENGKSLSLRDLINRIPLDVSHPLYKELANGFPKGYSFAFPLYPYDGTNALTLKKGDSLTFSLYLAGSLSKYYKSFFEAIWLMCDNGIGHPKSPFTIDSIYERSHEGELHLMAKEDGAQVASRLLFPVTLADFMQERANDEEKTLCIDFLTPVNLYKKTEKKERQLSFQDKYNGFPGIYQLIRSAANRMAKLTILYMYPRDFEPGDEIMKCIDEYIEFATNMRITSAEIKYINLTNTPKKESENRMPLQGYVGRQVYAGFFNRYLPMLKFMEELGVGHELVYGLGRIKVVYGSEAVT